MPLFANKCIPLTPNVIPEPIPGPFLDSFPNKSDSQQLLISERMAGVGRHCDQAIASTRINRIRIIHRQIIRLQLRRTCALAPPEPGMDRRHLAQTETLRQTNPVEAETTVAPDERSIIRWSDSAAASETMPHQQALSSSVHVQTQSSSHLQESLSASSTEDLQDLLARDSLSEPEQVPSLRESLTEVSHSLLRLSSTTSGKHCIAVLVVILFILFIYFMPIIHKKITSGSQTGTWTASSCPDDNYGPHI